MATTLKLAILSSLCFPYFRLQSIFNSTSVCPNPPPHLTCNRQVYMTFCRIPPRVHCLFYNLGSNLFKFCSLGQRFAVIQGHVILIFPSSPAGCCRRCGGPKLCVITKDRTFERAYYSTAGEPWRLRRIS